VSLPAAVLNHFHVTAVGGGDIGNQVSGTQFSIVITAIDQYGATLNTYTGTNTLTYSGGTIAPTTTAAFVAGVRTEPVTLTGAGTGVTISTAAVSDPTKTGISNTFDVNAGSGTFGSSIIGISGSSDFGNIRGSRYTTTLGGTAQSITPYLTFAPPTSSTLGQTSTNDNGQDSIENTIRGQIFTATMGGSVQSISAYIESDTSSKLMRAAIYNADGTLVATTSEQTVTTGNSFRTFTFASQPTLSPATQYILVVSSQDAGGGAYLRYTFGTGAGRYVLQTYGTWPTLTFSSNTRNYDIYCTYTPTTYKAQTALYSSDGSTRLGITEERTLTVADNGWVTFDFIGTGPALTGSTNYVLMAWASDDNNVDIPYNSGGVRYQGSGTYNTWPTTVAFDSTARTYSIYCTYLIP
jgi:hypothetical protein